MLRWQAHEALIHRIDAELATGEVTATEPALAADGIVTVLRYSYVIWAPWGGTVTPVGLNGRLVATDTGETFDVSIGRFQGTSPNTGTTYDEDTLIVGAAPADGGPADGEPADGGPDVASTFTISGTVEDLNRWLWGRGDIDRLTRTGDGEGLERFLAIIAAGVQ